MVFGNMNFKKVPVYTYTYMYISTPAVQPSGMLWIVTLQLLNEVS